MLPLRDGGLDMRKREWAGKATFLLSESVVLDENLEGRKY